MLYKAGVHSHWQEAEGLINRGMEWGTETQSRVKGHRGKEA